MRKAFIIFGIIVVIFIAVMGIIYRTSILSLSELYVKNISIEHFNTIKISGDIISSAKAYRGYKYEIVGEDIYIYLKGGLVTKKNYDGSFSFAIQEDSIKNVKRVFLKHRNELLQMYPEIIE